MVFRRNPVAKVRFITITRLLVIRSSYQFNGCFKLIGKFVAGQFIAECSGMLWFLQVIGCLNVGLA